jgi:hypothetical protein
MKNKVLLTNFVQYVLDKNYIDYAISMGFKFGAWDCNNVFSIDGIINDIGFKVIFLNENERWFEENKELKNELHINILEIYPLDINIGRFDKSQYNSIKNKIKKEYIDLLKKKEIFVVFARTNINNAFAKEKYQYKEYIEYDSYIFYNVSELIEKYIYGEIKFLKIDYKNKDIAKNNGAIYDPLNKKWFYFPNVQSNLVLKDFEFLN